MLIVAETPRLVLRTWQESDLIPFAELIGQKHSTQSFAANKPASKAETELWRYQIELDQRGWSRWAVVLKESNELIGYCGFSSYGAHVEMSWRFKKDHRGKGLVVEAAEAIAHLGLDRLGFGQIISFAAPDNEFATAVMKDLGMRLEGFEGWSNMTVARYSMSQADR